MMGAALPRFRFTIAASALLCTALASGCTSTDLGLEPEMSFAGSDPVLPEKVETLPAFSTDASTDAVVASAFAGPTPDNPAAAVFMPGKAVAPRSPELDALIARYAAQHEIPVSLLRRVVERESTFNPAARNGPYWGLMQILPQTARTMGYRGTPEGLLDAETNLMYAGKYLRGAYITAGGDHDLAVRFYSRGYYYDAKRKGLLEETGLRPARTRMAKSS
ncbi:transglycosylase SLT domain-containing protein [Neoaquamicrobium sediminum]|uniref:transglycosylase SLT domain-containing protein n=1 Tax=Neoaquamicrobium sediminum TaxID=1849104 RepID=UPI00156371A4|nr:lytic transglycosylase domain-containing protein [Mesorhizobium sediminum]